MTKATVRYGNVVLEEVPVYGAGRLALVSYKGKNVLMREWRATVARALVNAEMLMSAQSAKTVGKLLG